MNREEIAARMSAVNWYHTIELAPGLWTPGVDHTPRRIEGLALPSDLSGWSVLDIGAWDGALSFEAERRGAARVLATDSFCWGGEGWGTKQGFEFARRALDSHVEDLEIDVLDLSPERIGTFDLVLFVGVLYHMRHPLLALERVASVTERLLLVDTHVSLLDEDEPMLRFYPGSELADDPTNWFGPNPAAVDAMLRTVGFSRLEGGAVTRLDGDRPPTRGWRRHHSVRDPCHGRYTVHAWR